MLLTPTSSYQPIRSWGASFTSRRIWTRTTMLNLTMLLRNIQLMLSLQITSARVAVALEARPQIRKHPSLR
jgi:hypothetical protein